MHADAESILILNSLKLISDFVRKKVTEDAVDKISTTFAAKTIHIGSYKFEPKEKVIFSSIGMRIIAPNTKRETENVILDIQKSEIVKIVCHFGNSFAVLLIWTTRGCGLFVRDSLEMVRSSDLYFDPSSISAYNKKIILQMDYISEEAKTTIKSIFTNQIIEEISHNDAMNLLEISTRNHKTIKNETNPTCRYVILSFLQM